MKMKSFVKQFAAFVKGDDVQVQAEKTFRQADSALKVQISALEGDTVNLEDKVETAKEDQQTARINNGKPITNRDSYVENLLYAKNNVTTAEKALKTHLEKIEFLKSEKASLEKEVTA